MAKSSEYPDLTWVEPRAWGRGRDGKAVRYIVIHYTAGSERATSAEDGARYNQTRTDGTSAHYFVDRDSVVQGVLTRDRANCARHRGNRLGIQYELCGTAQTRAQWLDAASLPTLRNAARQAARDCRKYNIPVRRLTVDQTRKAWTDFPAGPRGFVGHVDCTYAYPEDGGDHTDPGTGFPWDIFLDMVRDELAPPAPKEWDEMATKAEVQDAAKAGALAALQQPVPYILPRIKARGWADLSVNGKLDYLFEGIAAAQPTDVDDDGDLDGNSVQARLTRVETALAEIKTLLTPPVA
jgi:N-acetyl-anhydromuramyl-L-alanine amidase AmpD